MKNEPIAENSQIIGTGNKKIIKYKTMARIRRLKFYNDNTGTVYHCISRTVNKEFLWDDEAKEVFRKQLWKTAAFCGVEVLSYCFMSNHFHILVRVVTGRSAKLPNEALQERLRNFYTNPRDGLVLSELLAGLGSIDAQQQEATRRRLLARMDDLSSFMKLLKQRFSIWYNRSYGRVGTHWCERFQSLLVQDVPYALRLVSAYIALNPVRAGLCCDPKDYRFSSYAEALAGNPKALRALRWMMQEKNDTAALAEFRNFLYTMGVLPKKDGSGVCIAPEEARKVLRQGGDLPLAVLYSCKITYFTRGVVLGTREYLRELESNQKVRTTRRTRPWEISLGLEQAWCCFRRG